MSRAFVDEDAPGADGIESFALKIPVPPGSRNYLTPEGADALSRELHELTETALPRAAAELAARTAPGTGPDFDALETLRKRLGGIERRIAYLDAMASLAEVVPPPAEGTDRVKFGARVRVREEGGSEREYRIVGIDEAQPERGWIGWPSPVARSLMGRRTGDVVTVKLPQGEKRLTVVAVGYA